MVSQTPAKIFLADERGLAESDRFRRYSTFNFGEWAQAYKGTFGRLFGLNEETLAGNHALNFMVAEASHVLIIPITGAVTLRCGEAEITVGVEETAVFTVPAGSGLHIQNPFADDLVSFLHCWMLADASVPAAAAQLNAFSLATQPNQLVALTPVLGEAGSLPFAARLGRFAGRAEAVYRVSQPESGLFVFVLAGAFEVEGRLLHEKDGLALWHTSEFELEALSNDALVLVLELKKPATA